MHFNFEGHLNFDRQRHEISSCFANFKEGLGYWLLNRTGKSFKISTKIKMTILDYETDVW